MPGDGPKQYPVTGAVTCWYCQCRAHVTSILWFLGYERHTNFAVRPTQDWADYLDAAVLPAVMDGSSESEMGATEE